MDDKGPQIFDYAAIDPEKAPRTTAIILLVCGLMGVGFLLVNIFATGDDPYYNEADWDNGTEQVHPRYDIMPNMVRTRQFDDEDDEAQDVPVRRPVVKPPTTNPFMPQVPGLPTVPGLPQPPGSVTTTPGTPGAKPLPTPGLPTIPGSGSSTPGQTPTPGTPK